MSTQRKERFTERNNAIRGAFDKMLKDKPQWRIEAVIDEISKKFFLSKRTVEAIVRHEGIYQ